MSNRARRHQLRDLNDHAAIRAARMDAGRPTIGDQIREGAEALILALILFAAYCAAY